MIKRGRAWHEKSNYDNAIDDFNKALSGNADHADRVGALNERGLAFSDKGEYDLAITDFTEAIYRGHPDKALATLY